MIPLIENLAAALLSFAAAWGIPIGYLLLCAIANRCTAARAVPLPQDIGVTSTPPDLHPVLLGALRCHHEGDRDNECNAYGTALAAVVAMIGRGELSFDVDERRATSSAVADQSSESAMSPFITDRRARKPRRRSPRNEAVHTYGSSLWLSRTGHAARSANASGNSHGNANRRDADREYDAAALELVMPPQVQHASIEELYGHAADSYKPLGRFLSTVTDDLVALNLAQHPGMLSRIIFSAPVAVAVCLSCLFCPSLVLEHPGTADAIVLCVMLIAVMIGRATLVDLGVRLTPAGARVLAQANANVRWAEGVKRGSVAVSLGLAPDKVVRLLATLLAMGRHDLAADVAECLACKGYVDHLDDSRAHKAIDFCIRRPYSNTSAMRTELSPADVLLKSVADTVDRMRS